MIDQMGPKLPKWPFFLGDAVLLGAAYLLCRGHSPAGHWETALAVLCAGAGAAICVTPFLLEYRAQVKLAEARGLTTVMAQMQNLEGIAGQISGATGRWQDAQEQADKTARAARDITEHMTTEVKAFTEFMQRANDSEKATLRLEVDKLRRAEADWLQVLVLVLDHVYALHQGALRSGQPTVITQVGHFQNACRDVARRVGLTPFVANDAEPFDAQRHQPVDNGTPPPADATVAETIASGYTFQGRLIRPALVRLSQNGPVAAGTVDGGPADVAFPGESNQLPLDGQPQ